MKKILEVLQYGNGEIRFNTDVDVARNPGQIIEIASMAAFSMATKLWGGNEQSVLAVLRALGMADLALCEHKKEMIREIEYTAQVISDSIKETMRELERNGAKVMTFAPNIMPPKMKS